MNKIKYIIICAFLCSVINAENHFNSPNEIITIPPQLLSKIGSGELIKVVSERINKATSLNKLASIKPLEIIIYQSEYPSTKQISDLENMGVNCYLESWTPPVGDHPLGFFIAEIPADRFLEVLANKVIMKVESAETLSIPQGNEVSKKIEANLVWNEGIKGGGIKLAILDSGLDSEPLNPDLNGSITKKDYSNYPTLDDDVENKVISHGTQVAGAALGSGSLSVNNSINGGGSYCGVAPEANLIFLKIGNDINGGAKTSAILNALDAAVTMYGAKVISLSYGSWDIYHDGSGTQDQKVDWCYAQGVPVFLAAGNEGRTKRHYSGLVNGFDSTGFIRVDVSSALSNSTYLAFNTIWFDGLGIHNELKLKYYNSSYQEITNTYNYTQTESTKGTESSISQVLVTVPEGNSIYYLKIINNSNVTQQFHIYEHYKDGKVTFADADPNYTLVSPATATYGFSVGAFTSRQSWTASNGSTYTFGENLDQVCAFSSRGPRIDGLQKPDLVAPGSGIISLKDRDVQTTVNPYWIDNDGIVGGEANYYVVQGTSFAAPIAAGAAVLLMNTFPNATPLEILGALRNNSTKDEYTGSVPNSIYGYGKINIYSAVKDAGLVNKYAIKLNAKVLLNGPYSSGIMNTYLRSNNLLPLSQPYCNPPWNYKGSECATNIPSDIVDWVLIEIRSNIEASSLKVSRAGFIKNDGTIVDIDGNNMVNLPGLSGGLYYVVIKHRNHLSVMSSTAISLTTTSSLFDFTSSQSSAYGVNAMKSLGNGKFGMWAGDANGDGTINSMDLNEYWIKQNATSYEYFSKPADFNLDGNINATDLNLFWILNNGISTKVMN
jgi:hypothetical protein